MIIYNNKQEKKEKERERRREGDIYILRSVQQINSNTKFQEGPFPTNYEPKNAISPNHHFPKPKRRKNNKTNNEKSLDLMIKGKK